MNFIKKSFVGILLAGLIPGIVYASACDNKTITLTNKTKLSLSVTLFPDSGTYSLDNNKLTLAAGTEEIITVSSAKGSHGDAEGRILVAKTTNANDSAELRYDFDTGFLGWWGGCTATAHLTAKADSFLVQVTEPGDTVELMFQ